MNRLLGGCTLLAGLACAVGEGATPHRAAPPQSGSAAFGIGRTATAEEIAAWDIDIMPDGTGLPPGSGSVARGMALYAAQCASCHGPTGVEGPYNVLVGRVPGDAFPFGNDPSVRSTIGNYWPYATTLYDYINRTMPFEARGNLQPDEIYSFVAALLHMNGIIGEDEVMNAETLPEVRMPARDRFVRDDRTGGAEIR
ncbi:MAG: c-type cytochrome [Gemmatimonadetes bacterium]|nr:c-type cytochrome [Gemmatimonadota bacterium]